MQIKLWTNIWTIKSFIYCIDFKSNASKNNLYNIQKYMILESRKFSLEMYVFLKLAFYFYLICI